MRLKRPLIDARRMEKQMIRYEPLEIPDTINCELERLHEILTQNNDDDALVKWAKEKIDLIYSIYFKGQIVEIKE